MSVGWWSGSLSPRGGSCRSILDRVAWLPHPHRSATGEIQIRSVAQQSPAHVRVLLLAIDSGDRRRAKGSQTNDIGALRTCFSSFLAIPSDF